MELDEVISIRAAHVCNTLYLPSTPQQIVVIEGWHLIHVDCIDSNNTALAQAGKSANHYFPAGSKGDRPVQQNWRPIVLRSDPGSAERCCSCLCDSPRVAIYTSQFHDCRMAIARLAELPKPSSPTRPLGSTPGTRRLRKPMMPAHSKGATCVSSRLSGMRTTKSACTSTYSAKPPLTVHPVKTGRSHRLSMP